MLCKDYITREEALNIPTVTACVELVSSIFASVQIKLYNEKHNEVEEIQNDIRVKLLNEETGDTLTAYDMKKAIAIDYLLMGNGYVYINKNNGEISSLHYVKENHVNINRNSDPIFKDYTVLVNGNSYKPYYFIKLVRHTDNGFDGEGLIE